MENDRLEWAGAIGTRAGVCYARMPDPSAGLRFLWVPGAGCQGAQQGHSVSAGQVFHPVGVGPRFRRSALAAVERGGLVEVDGTVVEALPKGIFRVEVPGGRQVLAHIAGPERMRLVRILPGDRVRVSLSPYDPGRGRIIDHHR